ncbi:SMC-Scp complex subunit ScpB [Priestia taiwanensis]|uniref:Segregation and condensation protein B n=1 Tax=Priestia taiwanensis TaxID=1347902 RepID=A0A917EKQ3_9BACI|nr:SMC-Scp complex subunit ScpB [Priestia taiwanensis]MBM7361498.1 segregation and condensation protein B [Priestia taiwanensis]GGE54647.1 segregation and condensation protein B [Priestia taiwanensis]
MADRQEHKAVIEGLLFVAGDEGIEPHQIGHVLDIPLDAVHALIDELKNDYAEQKRGLDIVQYGKVFQLSTRKEHASYYKKLWENPNNSSLSQAALEALAIISYRQPITRTEIEEIRGVKSERPIQTLVSKLLIKEVGRAEGTGRAILYGTTKEFLNHFGLRSLEELPPLAEEIEVDSEQQEADLFFSKFTEATNE